MIFEDDDPKTKKPQLKILDDMSIDELEAYIQDMKTEIDRVQKEIEKKQSHSKAAEALFGKS